MSEDAVPRNLRLRNVQPHPGSIQRWKKLISMGKTMNDVWDCAVLETGRLEGG